MPILTRDGKEYRTFSEPNPLMDSQQFVEKSELILHNFDWKPHVEKKINPTPKKTSQAIDEFVSSLSKPADIITKVEEVIEKAIEPIIEKIETVVKQPDKKDDYLEVQDNAILIVHVLPVQIVEKKDELYNEIRRTKRYGKKFEIECVLMDISDLEIQILTESKVEINSIIYPSKYKDDKKADINRWWEVKKIIKLEENYLINAIVSNFHPDFSG